MLSFLKESLFFKKEPAYHYFIKYLCLIMYFIIIIIKKYNIYRLFENKKIFIAFFINLYAYFDITCLLLLSLYTI